MNGVVISGPKRFLYGGLGSLLPTLYAIAMGRDFENVFAHPTWATILGWLVRTAALFAIGGLTVVFLKQNLKSLSMIFLTGVVAPGIVRAVVSQDGAAVFTPPQSPADMKSAGPVAAPSVHAQMLVYPPPTPPEGRTPPAPVQPQPLPRPKPQPVRPQAPGPMKSFLVALRG